MLAYCLNDSANIFLKTASSNERLSKFTSFGMINTLRPEMILFVCMFVCNFGCSDIKNASQVFLQNVIGLLS
jgi:hypothetical protein